MGAENFQPPPGDITRGTPLSFDVTPSTDDAVVFVVYEDTGSTEVVYHNGIFTANFRTAGVPGSDFFLGSERQIGDVDHYILRRRGGWPSSPSIFVEGLGGEATERRVVIDGTVDEGSLSSYAMNGPAVAVFDESNGGNLTAGTIVDFQIIALGGCLATRWWFDAFFDQTGAGDPALVTMITEGTGWPAVDPDGPNPIQINLCGSITVPTDGPLFIYTGTRGDGTLTLKVDYRVIANRGGFARVR